MLVAIHSPGFAIPPAQALVLRAHRGRRRGLSGLFDPVSSVIQTVEGWFPGSVSYRLNNPGNLLYAGQPGAVPHPITSSNGTVHVFAEFPTVAAGQAALDAQIALDASRGLTIAQFANKYAPAQDSNDPASYAAQIAAASGLSVNDPLSAAGTAVSSVPVPVSPDLSSMGAGNIFTDTGQPAPVDTSGVDDSGLASVSPVAWAALAGIGLLYVVASA